MNLLIKIANQTNVLDELCMEIYHWLCEWCICIIYVFTMDLQQYTELIHCRFSSVPCCGAGGSVNEHCSVHYNAYSLCSQPCFAKDSRNVFLFFGIDNTYDYEVLIFINEWWILHESITHRQYKDEIVDLLGAMAMQGTSGWWVKFHDDG